MHAAYNYSSAKKRGMIPLRLCFRLRFWFPLQFYFRLRLGLRLPLGLWFWFPLRLYFRLRLCLDLRLWLGDRLRRWIGRQIVDRSRSFYAEDMTTRAAASVDAPLRDLVGIDRKRR